MGVQLLIIGLLLDSNSNTRDIQVANVLHIAKFSAIMFNLFQAMYDMSIEYHACFEKL